MEMRSRFLNKLTNTEVESYLEQNDIIIVPVGTVEMHGGLPLDCETVISEAIALKMAEACDGLVLPNLPYFYAGATATGRGTTQVSVRQGIDYLGAIARSLLRQGFKRQIYISFHGPAHMTCSPMVRDFFDETGVPILYMDMVMQLQGSAKDIISMEEAQANPMAFMEKLDSMFVGAYDMLGRLEDVPITSEYFHTEPQTVAKFNPLFGLAYQSGSVAYCFGDPKDHASTTAIKSEEHRAEMAKVGRELIDKMVANMNMPKVVEDLKQLKEFEEDVMDKYPWIPAAYNTRK